MGMEITKSFIVKAPAAAVWDFLTDPYRVGRCLPGAAITDKVDDQTYTGTITIKVGPVTASYRGKMRFERLDPAAMEADIAASGQETKGKGGADMRMKSRVVAKGPAETEVTVVSDVNVMGVLAQFGRGMIQDVSDQLFQKFTDGMRRELETPAVVAPPAVETPAVEVVDQEPAAPAQVTAPQTIAPPPPMSQDVLDVGSLGAKAASRAAGRMLRGPIFWIAVIILAFLIYWLTRH
jgi:carbon monoxide dehydrogenase subunit G